MKIPCTAVLAFLLLAACDQARTIEGRVTGCTDCHGGADNATGAPPFGLGGQAATSSPGVGAHSAHVAPPPAGLGLACGECHPDPRQGSAVHRDGRVELAFGALATSHEPGAPAPRFDAGEATCSNIYCHGTFSGGAAANAPAWAAVGQGQAACGTCHGLPPPAPHPAVGASLEGCNPCHQQTVDAGGGLILAAAGGKHVNGLVDVSEVHPASWMDPTSAAFHAATAVLGLAACQRCHGPALDQIAAGDCARCHGQGLPPGVAGWAQDCTMCHGGTDNGGGAPPRGTWGRQADPIGIGAHSAHVGRSDAATTTGGGLASKLGCESCHVRPADALAVGHVDGNVTVTGYTGADPALAVVMTDPGWTRASATCATSYCHGATLQGGTLTAPAWSAPTGTQAACGACHGRPPATGPLWAISTPAHLVPKHLQAGCQRCHDGFTTSGVNPALHVNGRADVSLSHPAPLPDPPYPTPPTADTCAAPTITTVTTPVTGWDCAGCHRLKDYIYYRCCEDPGAPAPGWCATYW